MSDYAYKAGQKACQQGKPEHACPYEIGGRYYQAWMQGYQNAAVAGLIEAARGVTFHARFTDPEAHYHEVTRPDMDALITALARVRSGS